ncbi:uncharacterized protein CDAR_258521 [Caerostris darwini]|uniref:Uncharacterized protein n=1 Tax=Caerostris darwini TaxID=1538125 RepID=A0AAV4RK21_9ARAC|nr:uncharacterized protein CDAR_258521 [Caerostris darwini]
MTIFNIDPDSDTVTSSRPYQDVIAINELSDLDSFETRHRKKTTAERTELTSRFPWMRNEILQELEDRKKYFGYKGYGLPIMRTSGQQC